MLFESEMDKLVMVPGPTPVHREILGAIAEPTIWHSSAEMARIVLRCQEGIREIAGAQTARAFIFGGSGTLAQEAAVVNLVAPGERMLVVSNGFFGDRFEAIGESYGIRVDRIAATWGESVTADELRDRLQRYEYRAVTITQVDTSTGTAAPIEELAPVVKQSGAHLILDSVCALGGMPIDMDRLQIDIMLSGAQKALGVPPGLVILAVSGEAWQRRQQMGQIPAYYADLLNWDASMQNPQVYFSTHAVNLFYALESGLDIVKREGLRQRFERHSRLANAFRAGARSIGFQTFTHEHVLAPTLSVVAYPHGVDDEAYRASLSAQGVIAAPTMGDWKGKGLRVGHMGNITESDILRALAACEGALFDATGHSEAGTAKAAAQRELALKVPVASH